MIVQSPRKMVEMKRLIRRCVKFLVQVQLEVSGERFIIIHGTDNGYQLQPEATFKCGEISQMCGKFGE